MKKKLIGFNDKLLEQVEAYADEKETSFTKAVRYLIEKGLYFQKGKNDHKWVKKEDTPTGNREDGIDVPEPEGDAIDFPSLVHMVDELTKNVEKLTKDMNWWNADDNESKVGNLQLQVNEMEKKVNILVKTAKFFKGHINNREIHLQD